MHLKPINCRGPFFAITECILLAGEKNVNECDMLKAMKEKEVSQERSEVEVAREYFQKEGIEMVLFDMDSTLVETTEGFKRYITEFGDWIRGKSGSSDRAEFIYEKFFSAYKGLREEFGVYPTISEVIADNLRKEYGLVKDEEYEVALMRLMKVYRDPFKECQGARKVVELVMASGIRTGVVTIAGEEWTQVKIREHFFGQFEGYYCVDALGKKDKWAWKRGLDKFGIQADEVMVVGDSWWSDVVPALQLGVNRVVWVNEDNEDYQDERVLEIRGIRELREVWLDGATPGNRTQDLLFTKQPL